MRALAPFYQVLNLSSVLWDAFPCFDESAMAARGSVLGDQVVYAAHIEFSLSNRSEIEIAREVFLSIPIYDLEEQAETMERRAHEFRHDDFLNSGEGNKECRWSGQRQNEPAEKGIILVGTGFGLSRLK